MIKKILLLTILISVITQSTFAQEKDGFDWNKVFAGGTLVLGLGFGNNSQLTLGGNPEIGYSIFKSVDLGICGNYIYSSSSYNYDNTYKQKTHVTLSGFGVFARVHISDGFFLHLQPEFNNIKYKLFYEPDIPASTEEGNLKSSSFLVGAGFGTRDVGNINFFTLILVDLQKDKYSPYRTSQGDISPVLRSGINFYFGRGKKK